MSDLKQDREVYVLDTSALFAFIEDEEGAGDVEGLLIQAEKGEIDIHVAFISLTEVFYISSRKGDEDEALKRVRLIQCLAVKVGESEESLNLEAGRLKAKNRISLADAYNAALCRGNHGILVHKDPEFEKIHPPITEHRLPYKRSE
jgi:predicted nucleic acid-binding protein